MNRRYLLAVALAVAPLWGLAAQSVRTGIEAWQRADYVGAVRAWRPLAEKGDADAQFNLGQAYRLGRGVTTNLAAARTWFERAANQGHVDAETTLGLMLFQNGDRTTGLKWLKAAADRGEPRAELIYGTALVNGDGVTQDPALGYAFVSRSAAQGLAAARETLEQLDRLLPAAERRKGVALGRNVPSGSPLQGRTRTAKVATAKASPPRTAAAPKTVATTTSQPAEAPSPARTPARSASGNWRIQLGAFGQRGSAEALYRKLSARPALAGRSAFYIPVGAITRLQVGPFETKAAAQAACTAAAVPCFPVPAR